MEGSLTKSLFFVSGIKLLFAISMVLVLILSSENEGLDLIFSDMSKL